MDRNNYHYEATDLHEVAAGTQPAEKITYNIMDVVDEKMTTFIQGTVKTIDAATQTVALEDGQTINYDYLVVSLGFESESLVSLVCRTCSTNGRCENGFKRV